MWKLACKFPAEHPIPRADLDDSSIGGSGMAGEHPADPAFVPHEEIDSPQVAAAALCLRIVGREMVEQFRDDEAWNHLGES